MACEPLKTSNLNPSVQTLTDIIKLLALDLSAGSKFTPNNCTIYAYFVLHSACAKVKTRVNNLLIKIFPNHNFLSSEFCTTQY